jgi:hypothetical protein
MADNQTKGTTNGGKLYESLSLLGDVAAICLPAWLGAALGEYWFESGARAWGAAIGAMLGCTIPAARAWSSRRPGNLVLWLLAVGMCIGSSRAPVGRTQSLSTEFGRLLGLSAGMLVLVLGYWALSRWQARGAT